MTTIKVNQLKASLCVQARPLRTVQRCEAYPQQSDFVTRADHVAGADAHRDLLDVLQILIELGQQPRGRVLLEPEELTASKRSRG